MFGKKQSKRQDNKPQLFFKQDYEYRSEKGEVNLEDKKESKAGRNPILCRACSNEITDAEYSTIVDGEHQHTFINPAGIPYHIGCFSEVYGCAMHGVPTYEFTWFAGFTWRFCSCARCFSQLGWYYQSRQRSFFGLIISNLIINIKAH